MNVDLVRAAGLGAVAGSRSFLAPALVSRAVRRSRGKSGMRGAAAAWSLLALGELAADKSPRMMSRLAPGPLAGRALLGAAVGAALAPRRDLVAGALVGATAAVASAYALSRARRFATRKLGSNVVSGALEDALAIGAGCALASQS